MGVGPRNCKIPQLGRTMRPMARSRRSKQIVSAAKIRRVDLSRELSPGMKKPPRNEPGG